MKEYIYEQVKTAIEAARCTVSETKNDALVGFYRVLNPPVVCSGNLLCRKPRCRSHEPSIDSYYRKFKRDGVV